jgi:hypothetical protein
MTLVALLLAVQDQDPLAKFGLKPTVSVVASDGKATLGEGETVELLGFADLAEPIIQVRTLSGRPLDKPTEDVFWAILDDRPTDDLTRAGAYGMDSRAFVLRSWAKDRDKRTLGLAFRLSGGPTTALDVREDAKKLALASSSVRPQSNGSVWVSRVLRPVLPKDSTDTTFDFRLEVPGGAWATIAEFPFGPDTKLAEGAIDLKQRWQAFSDFRTVEDRQVIVDYKGYFFTVTFPEALREMELEIVTNDPAEDRKLLPTVVTQHIRGEDQGEAFKGKDLFLVYGLTSRSEARRFTLRARPRRIVEFRGLPVPAKS